MNPKRTPKNRYNSGCGTERRKAQQPADKDIRKEQDTLKKIEAQMDRRAADIALLVSNMFKFMSMSAAMLPNMELDADIFRLKIDDDGIFFEISHPFRKHRECNAFDGCDEEPDTDYDDDEEGLIYDGD